VLSANPLGQRSGHERIQIAVHFGDHRGYFLYHCHILEHEDGGMMRNFRVI
jgi:FtsP/CotA-like multicopper oxidase with cupredoxin domain